jgi:hypothetical protein
MNSLFFLNLTTVDYASADRDSLIIKSDGIIYNYLWNGEFYELCE